MKIITVHCTAKPEKRSEVINLCQSMIAPSRSESGCVSYNFFQDMSNENSFFFYEEWKNQSAVDFHIETPHYQLFQQHFNSLLDGNATLTIHNVE